jgi:hypothetical protein
MEVYRKGRVMNPAIVAAWIAASVAIASTVAGSLLVVWGGHRQRAIDLVVAALSHMGGGSQERSAGLAALMALRGPLGRSPGIFEKRVWAIYGAAVGQQIYRQLIYLLNYGENRYKAHEVETMILMVHWLLNDTFLEFNDSGQRYRLACILQTYGQAAAVIIQKESAHIGESPVAGRHKSSIEQALYDIPNWRLRLSAE